MTKLSYSRNLQRPCTLCGSNLHSLPDHDTSDRYNARDIALRYRHHIVSPLRAPRQTIEAYTDGSDRRAQAWAWLTGVTPGNFAVIPFRLQETSGAWVSWTEPAHGQSIATTHPISSMGDAVQVLAYWASWTFAYNATPHR